MRLLFETFLGVFLIMITAFVNVQMVLTNVQISSAREYHETVIERIENSGLSEDVANALVSETAKNTGYELTVTAVDGYEDSNSYHVSLKYAVSSPLYEIFSKQDSTQYAIIDGYASVGGNTPKTTASMEEKHGNKVNTTKLTSNIKAYLYEDGYLIIEGDGDLDGTDIDDMADLVTNIAFTEYTGKIPSGYFKDFKNLEGVYLNKVSSISSEAFKGCENIKTIAIPNSVTDIGSGAFSGCVKLTTIYVDNNKDLININEQAFDSGNIKSEVVYLR